MNLLLTYAPHAARIGLGLMFLVFGLNGFFHFLPTPTPEGAGAEFMGGLAASGYFFPFLKGTEVLVGLALLLNRFSPLALVVLAPISLNILVYNVFLMPSGIPMAAFIILAQVFLMWTYRDVYAPLLRAKAEPQIGASAA